MIFVEHECDKDEEIAQLLSEKDILEAQMREERCKNYRLQVQLIEALSKSSLNIELPDALNPDLNEIERREENVSETIVFNSA